MLPTEKGYNLLNITLSELASLIKADIAGDDCVIRGFGLSNRELQGDDYLSYCASTKYLKYAFNNDKVKALVVSPEVYIDIRDNEKLKKSYIVVDYPEEKFYQIFCKVQFPAYDWKTDLSTVQVGIGAVIEDGVILGKDVVIGSNTVIKSGTIIGDNVKIGCCSVIGNNGFQMIKDSKGQNMTIPHTGRTKIGNNVIIGDCTTISRSLFDGFTEIGNDTKIDNQVHIAHNCIIGENNVITAHASLFGSVTVRNSAWIAPNASIMNRVVIGDGAMVCAHSFAAMSVKPGAKVFGLPAIPKHND